MITITIDVVQVPLVGIGNVASVCLALFVTEATTNNWAIVTFTYSSIYKTYYDL